MLTMRSRLLAILAGAMSALGCLSGSVQARLQGQPKTENPPVTPVKAALSAAGTADPARAEDLNFARNLSRAFRGVAGAAGPSVVHITQINSVVQRRSIFDPGQVQMLPTGLGSGMIISPDGLILTNNHVIQLDNRLAEQLQVKLSNGKEYPATLVGRDPRTDLAVIKIDAEGLPAISLGDSDALEVGDWVIAIGSPFGLSNTVTAGIVSAKGRPLNGDTDGRVEDFIQTDAAINPGNSGGPLLNLNGEVVGINSAIFSRTGGYEGIGFAIPSSLAKDVVQNIVKNGRVVRGYLGVGIADAPKDADHPAEGVLVQEVPEGSPAAKAGIKVGDIIKAFQGRHLDSTRLHQSIAVTPPGTDVKLDIIREGKPITITATLSDLNAVQAASNGQVYLSTLGAGVRTFPRSEARQYGRMVPAGVIFTSVETGSQADDVGLRSNDIITAVDGERISSAEQLAKTIAAKEGKPYQIKVYRQGQYLTGQVGE